MHTSFSDRNLKIFGGIFKIVQLPNSRWRREVVHGGHGGKSSNSGRKPIFTDLKETKKEWKRCYKRVCLEGNIFKVQRRACAADNSVLYIILLLLKRLLPRNYFEYL